MRSKSPRDLLICAVQYIIDHPDLTAARIAENIDISHASAHRLKSELGFQVRHYQRRQSKELIACQCRFDVAKTAAELERHGYQLTMRQVLRLCGQAPWSRRDVERHVRQIRKEQANG